MKPVNFWPGSWPLTIIIELGFRIADILIPLLGLRPIILFFLRNGIHDAPTQDLGGLLTHPRSAE